MKSFNWKQKHQNISKNVFTDRKNDDVTFWEMGGVKTLPPSIIYNFIILKSTETKKLFLASLGKREDKRACIIWLLKISTNGK